METKWDNNPDEFNPFKGMDPNKIYYVHSVIRCFYEDRKSVVEAA